VFTDFNKNLRDEKCRKYLQRLESEGLQVHMSKDETTYTRKQGTTTSYIDFFFTANVKTQNFGIGDHVGSSDHRCLEIQVVETNPVVVQRERKVNYKKVRAKAPQLIPWVQNLRQLGHTECLQALNAKVLELQLNCPFYVATPKNLFVEIAEVERHLGSGDPNFYEINRIIGKTLRTSYYNFLDLIQKLRLTGSMKEYYAKLGYLSRADCSHPFIEILQNPQRGEEIIVDQNTINEILSEKYKALFSRGIRSTTSIRRLMHSRRSRTLKLCLPYTQSLAGKPSHMISFQTRS
jgi:hypothetical protein